MDEVGGSSNPGSSEEPFRVLIVDDSKAVRRAIEDAFSKCPNIEIVGAMADGRSAVRATARACLSSRPVDVVLLDIEMPILSGLEALPQLVALEPRPRVIIASSLTSRGASESLRALALGASDYACKPSSLDGSSMTDFVGLLAQKVECWALERRKAVHRSAKRGRSDPTHRASARAASDQELASRAGNAPARWSPASKGVTGEKDNPCRRATGHGGVLAIGSSTGGPQALIKLLTGLRSMDLGPILITQHMPPRFTRVLAEQIGSICGRPTVEARDGDWLDKGSVYVAPGDFHLVARLNGDRLQAKVEQGPQENFCRPAVDPMLRSLAGLCGSDLLAIILTGMGQDGLDGCSHVKRHGGHVIVQDRVSSVVWGMPGAVQKAGLADAELPIDEMPSFVNKLLVRGR